MNTLDMGMWMSAQYNPYDAQKETEFETRERRERKQTTNPKKNVNEFFTKAATYTARGWKSATNANPSHSP